MASINRHAIEISSNTRTQCSETLPSSSLRGNPGNLGLPLPRVKSLRCDPRRDPPRRTFRPRSGPEPLPRPPADPLSRSPGHEEEHYAPPNAPSSQNSPFRGGLGHTAVQAVRHELSASCSAGCCAHPARPRSGPSPPPSSARCRPSARSGRLVSARARRRLGVGPPPPAGISRA